MALSAEAQVLGIVENLGTIVCPECGKEHPLFSSGEAGRLGAGRKGLPLLGRFPFRPAIAQAGQLRWSGLPEGLRTEASSLADACLTAVAKAASVSGPRKVQAKGCSAEGCEDCDCSGKA
jgi:ATP-binding protein involved in chromosome partitioning